VHLRGDHSGKNTKGAERRTHNCTNWEGFDAILAYFTTNFDCVDLKG
jgi:hypothetical protein